jgi:hypothetical protein
MVEIPDFDVRNATAASFEFRPRPSPDYLTNTRLADAPYVLGLVSSKTPVSGHPKILRRHPGRSSSFND